MSNIKLDNFVNINIDYITSTSANASRPVAVLLDNTSKSTRVDTKIEYTDVKVWESIEDFSKETFTSGTYDEDPLYAFVEYFFNNGGKKLKYIQFSTPDTFKSIVESLDRDEIVICATYDESDFYNDVKTYTGTGAYEKLFVSSVTETISQPSFDMENFVLKIGAKGIEMTIAAYLTQLDVDNGTLQDYCFTPELVKDSDIISDNATFATIKDAGIYNCDIDMLGARAFGGDTVQKKDFANYFTKIVLTQTLTDSLIRILSKKIKYDQVGLAQVSAAISDEMNRYKKFGYLSYDKVWDKGDVYVTGGDGKSYLTIANNTPLNFGYVFTILPMSSLSAADKQNHKLPAIYLYIADTYGIRRIDITGKII